MNKQEIMELVDAYADSVFRGVWEGRAAIEAALPDVPTVPTVPEGFRKEAKRLASILASMGEGGYEIETLYTKDQADGDGFVRRAADLLVLLSAAPEPAQPTVTKFSVPSNPETQLQLAAIIAARDGEPAQAEQPKCKTCNGEGGEEVAASSTSYFWRECPDCKKVEKAQAPAGVVSSTELGAMPGDEDGDLKVRYDMLKDWLSEADAVNDILKKHLGRVLEIAYTWQPSYATKMDRDTLTLAAKSIGYELPPNTTDDRPQVRSI
jgi:hypothetical protein